MKKGLVGRLKGLAGEVGRITDYDISRMLNLISGLETGTIAAQEVSDGILEELDSVEENLNQVYPTLQREISPGSPVRGITSERRVSGPGKQDLKSIPAVRAVINAIKSGVLNREQGKKLIQEIKNAR